MKISRRSGGVLSGMLAAAIWGSVFVVSDAVLPVIPAFLLLSIRLLLGFSLLAAPLVWRGGMRLGWRGAAPLLGVGMLGYGISIGMQFLGTDYSTAVNGALITSASPAFILIFAALILGERLTWVRVMALLLAMLGVLLIVNPAQADFTSLSFRGDALLALAAVVWGLYSVLVGLVSRGRDTLTVTAYGLLGGLMVTVPAALIGSIGQEVGTVNGPVIAGVIYLGTVATALSMWLWNRAFAILPAGTVALLFFTQPLVGALLAAIFLGQGMTGIMWLGAGFIAGGVFVALRETERLENAG